MIKDQITTDLKQAMLSGDTFRVTVLRGLKSAVLYAEVAAGKKEAGLEDPEIISVFQKEAKKRQDAIDLYTSANQPERAEAEAAEKAIIDGYLPAQLTEAEITTLVDAVIAELGATDMKAMGSVMGAVKTKAGPTADGAIVARVVKERLSA